MYKYEINIKCLIKINKKLKNLTKLRKYDKYIDLYMILDYFLLNNLEFFI